MPTLLTLYFFSSIATFISFVLLWDYVHEVRKHSDEGEVLVVVLFFFFWPVVLAAGLFLGLRRAVTNLARLYRRAFTAPAELPRAKTRTKGNRG